MTDEMVLEEIVKGDQASDSRLGRNNNSLQQAGRISCSRNSRIHQTMLEGYVDWHYRRLALDLLKANQQSEPSSVTVATSRDTSRGITGQHRS